ncbi:hypothetical protein QQ045_030707 [Rhodiola kirilowii]
MDGNACYKLVESETSTVYSISLYDSTITTRDEPSFSEFKLALGVIGVPVTARDRILRCYGSAAMDGRGSIVHEALE